MAEALEKRGGTPRTFFKIALMLGLVLAGVAALAAEPEPTPSDTDVVEAGCARTVLEFGGRTVENGVSTDTWVLTCQHEPAVTAAPATPTASVPAAPVGAVPVATLPGLQPPVSAAQF